jgi:hypothetical protein
MRWAKECKRRAHDTDGNIYGEKEDIYCDRDLNDGTQDRRSDEDIRCIPPYDTSSPWEVSSQL